MTKILILYNVYWIGLKDFHALFMLCAYSMPDFEENNFNFLESERKQKRIRFFFGVSKICAAEIPTQRQFFDNAKKEKKR